MYTEEEAKKKWCPHARTVWDDGSTESTSWNRWVDSDPDSKGDKPVTTCLGSTCMAWRWVFDGYEYAETNNQSSGFAIRNAPPDEDPAWEDDEGNFRRVNMTKWRRLKKTTRGYCGLSGKPEE